jgi:hypothetical protein
VPSRRELLVCGSLGGPHSTAVVFVVVPGCGWMCLCSVGCECVCVRCVCECVSMSVCACVCGCVWLCVYGLVPLWYHCVGGGRDGDGLGARWCIVCASIWHCVAGMVGFARIQEFANGATLYVGGKGAFEAAVEHGRLQVRPLISQQQPFSGCLRGPGVSHNTQRKRCSRPNGFPPKAQNRGPKHPTRAGHGFIFQFGRHPALRYSTVQYSTVQYNSGHHRAVQHGTHGGPRFPR